MQRAGLAAKLEFLGTGERTLGPKCEQLADLGRNGRLGQTDRKLE